MKAATQHAIPMVAFARLLKVDEEKRLVYGRATQQVPDRSGEIMDYDKSKPYFEAWSKSQLQASMGKSAGNVRAMHGKVAAGVLIPDGGLIFNDAEKAVDIVSHVGDDASWKAVMDGRFTGFSIGGSYVSKSKPDAKGNVTYVADISEISLVDRPAVPTATFFEVHKADGSKANVDFAAPVMKALFLDDGTDLKKSVSEMDIPEVGGTIDVDGAKYSLVKADGERVVVSEIAELVGSASDMVSLAKLCKSKGMTVPMLVLALGKLEATPEIEDVEKRARALCKAAGQDPDKQIGLRRGGGKRYAWEEFQKAAADAVAADLAELAAFEQFEPVEAELVAEVNKLAKAEGLDLEKADEKAKIAALERLSIAAESNLWKAAPADVKAKCADAAKAKVDAELAKRAPAVVKEFADPANKRFPIDTDAQVQASWMYANMGKVSEAYKADEIKAIRDAIMAKAKELKLELEADAEKLAKSVTKEALKKGLYSCSRLAELIDSLCSLASSCEYEAAMEGDGSTVCDELYAACAVLGEVLKKMVAEEVAEAVAARKAVLDELGKKLDGFLAKASHTAVSVKRIQKMHDMAKGMGAKCEYVAGAPDPNAGASKADEPSEGEQAALEEIQKAEGVSHTAKVVIAKALQRRAQGAVPQDLAKRAAEADVLRADLAKATGALGEATARVGELTKRVETLEAQPMPANVVVRMVAVDKSTDSAGAPISKTAQDAANLAASVDPVLNQDGSINELATAIKMQQAKGGQSVTLKKVEPKAGD